ncbi:MAG: hypothetical protein N2439_10275 [Anaerolineae bacterium]|nr:hypothetical protein [Anaerolineae bacterium]
MDYTTERILASLGYSDPLEAARQHARMILLGRQARYEAVIRQLEAKWGCTLETLRARYHQTGQEDFAADDDYLQWQWYADARAQIEKQLAALTTHKHA